MKLSFALQWALLIKLSFASFPPDNSVRIAFGSKATQGEFPFVVPIIREIKQGNKRKYHFGCTATILNDDTILTAAHCIHGKDPRSLSIYLGHADISAYHNYSSVESKYKYQVGKVIPHPHYRKTISEDLGLLKLARKIDLTTLERERQVKTVCLPTKDEPPETEKCLILGWGRDENLNLPNELRKVTVRIATGCPQLFNADVVYCAVGATRSGNACPGDSGGPLICAMKSNPTVWLQYGITSYGPVYDCRYKRYSYETKISWYLEWIIKTAEA